MWSLNQVNHLNVQVKHDTYDNIRYVQTSVNHRTSVSDTKQFVISEVDYR